MAYCTDGIALGAEPYYSGRKALPLDGAMVLLDGGVRQSVVVDPADASAVTGDWLPIAYDANGN